MSLYSDKSKGLLALSNNIKLAVAANVYNVKLSVDKDEPSLLFKSKDFELSEPNAIVKYLAKDFAKSELIEYEEDHLYPLLKEGKASPSPTLRTADLGSISAASIIIFASAYALNSESFPDFAQLKGVKEGLEQAFKITSLEREKPVHTGASNIKPGFEVQPESKEILPDPSKRNVLITSALPYVNNVPHLGNIVGSVLSADIFARYAKARNYNTLFVCGTDEYGTATETKALEEGVTPRELCDKFNKLHADIYKWFQLDFDYFGRTSTDVQTEIAQDVFLKLQKNGYLEEKTMDQLYCPVHNGFLADRFVEGICPKCQYEDARGDQCDKCGNLLNPLELIEPRCKLDNAKPEKRTSEHVFLKLDDLQEQEEAWFKEASEKGKWSKNSITITGSWLKEGLNSRCITRDLKWGVPVPLEKFKNKVLYVWFDACLGYVSITASYTKSWEKWWKDPENVQLYQFMGKDNTPFHTVVFPSTQIGSGDNWTKLHHINTTEYLQYEGGKFSKSRGVGVFGNNAQDSGLPPSVWRYYLAAVRPETSDSQFSWDDFQSRNNNELLANLGNFVNRIVKFVNSKYNGVIPEYDPKELNDFDGTVSDITKLVKSYVADLEGVHERRALEYAMAVSARGNQFLQDNKMDNTTYTENPKRSDAIIGVGLNIVYLVSALIYPYMPEITKKITEMLNAPKLAIPDEFSLVLQPGHNIGKAQYLFRRIDDDEIAALRAKYGGNQKEDDAKNQ